MVAQRYLLDTNILSDLLKHPAGVISAKITTVGEAAVCTSIVVVCELRYGATKKGSPALSTRVDQLLSAIEILPLDEGVDAKYGDFRKALEKGGTTIGANDYLIAASGTHPLPQEPLAFIQEQVCLGRFASPTDVVCEALRATQEAV